ncbi:MAG TPA: response regulator transcription factor [Candidatus Polarisedimenticolia bacterium]|nr:response regulator transcription factor [Candidatus Polarisedimenticolia bacterium]
MRFLLVEDESALSNLIREGLQDDERKVDVATDGPEGIDLALKTPYDLIVLDVGLPTLSGIDVCRRLREKGLQVPILMLTARAGLQDKVQGLEMGADDYLTKPFALEELRARIQALLRRQTDTGVSPVVQVADLSLDANAHEVRRAGRTIELTSKEFALLEFLMRRAGRVLSRRVIQEHVWGARHESGTNVVDVYIRRLRQKIDRGFDPPLIRTLRGVGYQLKP